MELVLGFGSTEEQQRENTKKDIENIIKRVFKNLGKYENINDKDFLLFENELKKYGRNSLNEYEKIENLPIKERPERYFNCDNIIGVAKDIDIIYVTINFCHINSQHPFSPDGMAMLGYKETFTFYLEDLDL